MTKPEIVVHDSCRCCGSKDLTPLFSLGNPFINEFPSADDWNAGPGQRCPIDVELCRACTAVQLKHTAPSDVLYKRHYWFKSGTSASLRAALKDVVDACKREVELFPGDVVLDIGSNDGTLLKFWPECFTRVGFEPAENMLEHYIGGKIGLINEFWDAEKFEMLSVLKMDGKKPKVVSACGMMYDAEDPGKFIGDVAKVLHPDGVFVAQLMCLRQTVEQQDAGNLCHEHLLYFSLTSLLKLYERAGLEIYKVETNDVNGGSYRIWAQPKDGGRPIHYSVSNAALVERTAGLDDPVALNRFYQDMLRNMQEVAAYVRKAHRAGQKVWVRGASTKGNYLLQFMDLGPDVIEAAADMDSVKWGLHTVNGIPIRSLEAMRQMDPGLVVIMPYAFRDEIVEAEKDQAWRKRGGKFLVPLPKLEVL